MDAIALGLAVFSSGGIRPGVSTDRLVKKTSLKRRVVVRKITKILLVTVGLVPIAGHTAYVCTDGSGRTSVQDRPCPEKMASTTNVPIKAAELSDSNALETVNRFYKAMSERDPVAASQFLADTFTSEVRRANKPVVNDNKASMAAGLQQVLSAAKTYTAKTNCRIVNRASAAYSLLCEVDEEGIVMNRPHRTLSSQTVMIVLSGDVVKIGRIISEERK